MKITSDIEKRLRTAFEAGYKSNIMVEDKDNYQMIMIEKLQELQEALYNGDNPNHDVRDIRQITKQINILRQQGEAYRAGKSAFLLTQNINDINGEFARYIDTLSEDKKNTHQRRTPLERAKAEQVLGIKPHISRGLTREQIEYLNNGRYRNSSIQQEVERREIRRPTSGQYEISNKAKVAIGLAALAATLAFANIAASHAEEMPQKNPKEPKKNDTAKGFRKSMKIGEHVEYDYDTNTIKTPAPKDNIKEKGGTEIGE